MSFDMLPDNPNNCIKTTMIPNVTGCKTISPNFITTLVRHVCNTKKKEKRKARGDHTHTRKIKYHILHRVSSITSPPTRLRIDLESKAEPESEREHTTTHINYSNITKPYHHYHQEHKNLLFLIKKQTFKITFNNRPIRILLPLYPIQIHFQSQPLHDLRIPSFADVI
jgi:hypothetical protein